MNYIKQINSFWKTVEDFNLTTTQIALYLFLLQEFNLKRWPDALLLSNKSITCKLRLSEKTLILNRKRLCKIGLIQYSAGNNSHKKSTYRLIDINIALSHYMGATTGETTVATTGEITVETTGTSTGEITVVSENTPYIYNNKLNTSYVNDLRDAEKSYFDLKNKKEKKPSPSCVPPLPVELQERHKVVFSLFDFPHGVLQIKTEDEQKYLMQFDAYEALVHEGFLSFVMGFDKWAAGGWKKKDYTQELNRFRRFNKSKTTTHNGRAKKDYSKTDYSKGWDD